MYGIAGASATIALFASAHAFARSAGSTVALAFSITAFTPGSSSSDQFELLASRMSLPLKIGSMTVCGSAKSCAQPNDGQTSVSEAGTWQKRVSIVSRVTSRSFVLKPISLSCCSVICAIDLSGSALSATSRSVSAPSYLPDAKPAALKYFAASARSPSGLSIQSYSGQPSSPLDSSNPAIPGGIQCCAIGPSASPPRCWRAALAVEAGDHRLAHVQVVEGRAARVHRDRAPAAAGQRGELLACRSGAAS